MGPRRRRCGVVVAGCGVGIALLWLSVAAGASRLASASSGGVSLVTPAAAQAELRLIWGEREQARSVGDVAVLDQLDTGAARDRDTGYILYTRGSGLPNPWPLRPPGPSVVVVPYQTQYPISFLGFVETTGEFAPLSGAASHIGFLTVMLVLVKASHSAPWRVAIETHYGGGFGFSPPAAGAYAPPINPSETWVSPLAALDDLARLDQREVAHGITSAMAAAPGLFEPGPWTTGANSALANDGMDGLFHDGEFVGESTYSVDPATDGIYQFSGPGQTNIVCGAIRVHGSVTPARPHEVILQNANRRNWGGWLAPGEYSALQSSRLDQVCLGIYAPSDQGNIAVMGGESGLDEWILTGTPTSAQLAGPLTRH
jgi:hypothetical protein